MSGPAKGPTEPPIHWVRWLKRPGREVDRPLQSRAKVKNEWLCYPICLYGVHRDNCVFAFTPPTFKLIYAAHMAVFYHFTI
jgi:hypothetical protein